METRFASVESLTEANLVRHATETQTTRHAYINVLKDVTDVLSMGNKSMGHYLQTTLFQAKFRLSSKKRTGSVSLAPGRVVAFTLEETRRAKCGDAIVGNALTEGCTPGVSDANFYRQSSS